MKYLLKQGDCLEVLSKLKDQSIDLCLTDPPYGTTACKWDSVIPFEPMWVELRRVMKPNSAVCLFGSEPFSSALRMSNIKGFKYDWVWRKDHKTGHLNAKRRPMKSIELISVFAHQPTRYFPQGLLPFNQVMTNSASHSMRDVTGPTSTVSGGLTNTPYVQTFTNYPTEFLKFESCNGNTQHPTQKPVPLLEYLIKTYTLEGEIVLDFTMGSGSTGVACMNTNRKFVGIERDRNYFEIATKRIEEAAAALPKEEL
jgi:DNA modification methylase